MRFVLSFFIRSPLLLACAAVALSAETQVLLQGKAQWHHSWWVVFWATLVAYGFHGHWPSKANKLAPGSDDDFWRTKKSWLFWSAPVVLVGVVYQWHDNARALWVLGSLALLTFLYSYAFAQPRLKFLQLRSIPYFKIFCIGGVWATATVLLPALFLEKGFNHYEIWALWTERFVFVVAITLPFDIRDMAADKAAGLTTIPLKLGADKAYYLALGLVLLFMVLVALHFHLPQQKAMCIALLVSGFTTLVALSNKKGQAHPFYHKGILDGTLLLQALLVLFFQVSL